MADALPIDSLLPELLATLQQRSTVLLHAPPGAGKTTRVPPALLQADWLGAQRIVMLEPRRLAARAAARFMAGAMGQAPGQTVGFRTRLETRVSSATRIEVVTEGVLVRMLQGDPALAGIGAVIFDEFHERSLNADLGLALLRESQQVLRPDLRLVVMSATLETEPLARLLGDSLLLSSQGRSFPVEVRYRPPRRNQRLADAVAAAIRHALEHDDGSILVFLPGAGEIRAVADRLTGTLPKDVFVAPLYGALGPAEQDAAIAPTPKDQRKIVLSTAIAQTSLTIEGIRVVIDSGLERRSKFDPGSGMTRLATSACSRAASEQRCGRAGRIEPGVCYRLWSESEQPRLAAFSTPEILDADLASLVLELAAWGARTPEDLTWLDRPPTAHWNQAVELLQWLQALDSGGAITVTGKRMLATGVHPRLAHMLVRGEQLGYARTAAELAALLSERDVFSRGFGADLDLRLDALREPHGQQARSAQVQKLAQRLAGGQRDAAAQPRNAGALLALAFPDRVARRRPGGPARYQLSNGRGAWLADDDPLGTSEWLVAAELDGKAREARIFLAARTDQASIETVLAEHIVESRAAAWDEARGTVVVRDQRRLGALVLTDRDGPAPDPEQIIVGLLDAVQRKGLDALNWTESARQLCYRVECIRSLEPDQWPTFDGEALGDHLEHWLAPFLAGLTHWREVARLDLLPALENRLDFERRQRLDRLAPVRIEVPAGPQVRLDYSGAAGPVLAVKLQAVFGWHQTPRIANDRVPIVLHLLSPAGRPLAITSDLESFWKNAYPEVAKDMRGRYPKHPWPEDPVAAVATIRTKRLGN
ncbi:MAG: ATP-dependent helicase HrpB [Wenzhouxiangellaceae bacterium]|nr:ATP-dependent helicase HrpB [Wenzhouxiangellaceae bacterium]